MIEYSRDIEEKVEISDLVDTAHKAVSDSGLFAEANIKTRAFACSHYRVGTQGRDSFVHITVRALSGRNGEQKKALSELLIKSVSPLLEHVPSVSVDIRDMEKECYSKKTL